ncbi:unnamed protein product [Medioppia subpectinata]|uniref:RlpA-like protein double-psi beta-barrel domain-containing protein n=1 Tax=Medioppia subpectinata TaxID=1979941 RepID=A0A7R9L365_9ACAR|nr:unnamed protein product [Medioppia subpectinata]CAG2114440.1 unnamed protein product [Medioppia subpectinata]
MLSKGRLLSTTIILSVTSDETGICSWYGVGLDGQYTADGERFNGNDMTAAHKTLPFNTTVKASCNGKSVTVRINDRGPFVPGRILDLSRAAGDRAGIKDSGLCQCTLHIL